MIHNRKHTFTVDIDASKGETPDLLMVALAMAIFEGAPALHDDESGFADQRYAKDDVLTEEEARQYIHDRGRTIAMLFAKARMCMAHVFATRLSPEKAEIVFTMYDGDHEALMERAGECMDRLTAGRADEIDVDIELDEFDLEEITLDEIEELPAAVSA
jgi:hypothetical protein